jgi:hypothetical protein
MKNDIDNFIKWLEDWEEVNPPNFISNKFKRYKKNYRRYYKYKGNSYRVIDLLKDDKGDRRTFYFRRKIKKI